MRTALLRKCWAIPMRSIRQASAAARTVRIELQPFTLVGATTRLGLLTTPLRDRFGIPTRLQFYSEDELFQIVTRGARLMGIAADETLCFEVSEK